MKRFPVSAIAAATAVVSLNAFGATRPIDFGKVPLTFEANIGQTDSRVKYLSRGAGYTLFLTAENEAVMSLTRTTSAGERQSAAVRMSLVGSKRAASIQASDPKATISNYINGNDPKKWISGVHHYGRVAYESVYPGIDVVYYGSQRQLEYDFVVAPGANPSAIRLKFSGAESVAADASGDLVLHTQYGDLRQKRPVVYQDINGRRHMIEGRYVVRNGEAKIALGAYDRSKRLVIDPILVYSTFIGGTGVETGYSITVDAAQQAYIVGSTSSSDFPLAGGIPGQSAFRGGGTDGFLVKFSAAGNSILFATYIGGNGNDRATAVGVDGVGDVFVAGVTDSSNFPVQAALQSTIGGKSDAFMMKISGTGTISGTLVFSTYIGGFEDEDTFDLVVDKDNNAIACGVTRSTNFWAQGGIQSAFLGGATDGWVFKMNGNGTRAWSTYVGGNGNDSVNGVAVDTNANVYITGATSSLNFPIAGPFQSAINNFNFSDAFVSKINSAGSQFVYSTYLGGSAYDEGTDIAVNAAGEAYVTGNTESGNFPTVNSLQGPPGNRDMFVTKMNAAGNALLWSTFLAGSATDNAADIGLDAQGNAYILGTTTSDNFPLVNPIQAARAGGNDIVVTKINSAGTIRLWATYLGGISDDVAASMFVDSVGNIYLTGSTISADFPRLVSAQGPGGAQDAFLSKIAGCDISVVPGSAAFSANANSGAFTVNASGCPWVASSNDSFITITSPASGSNSAVVTYNVAANPGVARTGTISISGVRFTVNQAGLTTAAPTVVSLSPSTGSGTSQIFTARYATASPGGAPIEKAYILFNTTINGTGGCLVEFAPLTNTFRVINNDGASWTAPVAAGTQTTIGNSQCTLNAASSSGGTAGGVGTIDTVVNYSLTFTSSFAGLKNAYLLAISESAGLNSGWVQGGTWTVTSVVGPGVPGVVAVSPLSGSTTTATFSGTFTHTAGLSQHYLGYILILPTPNLVNYNATGTCLIEHNRISNGMRLINNAGTDWLGPLSGVPVGTPAATLTNNYCSIDVQNTTVATNGNNLTVSVPVTLFTTMGPVLGTFLQGFDVNGQFTGMTQFGNWTIPGAPQTRPGPQIVSLTPASVVGSSATYTLSVTDSAGANTLTQMHLLISDRIVGGAPCQIIYFPLSNTLNMINDTGTALVSPGGVTPGTGTFLANSRCSVNTAGVVVTSGVNRSVSIPVTFSLATFAGSKNVYAVAFDTANLTSHWVQGGTIIVQ